MPHLKPFLWLTYYFLLMLLIITCMVKVFFMK